MRRVRAQSCMRRNTNHGTWRRTKATGAQWRGSWRANEPCAKYGPLMNTPEQIHEAIRDYPSGRF
ncbi:MAG: hypothetical protein J0L88_14345 [Xanthomonadales bacterium]|nr:hypothetical protein [Xanthomonadales bacterium]